MKAVKNYVYTERAHLMCPNMHFGIMAQIKKEYEIEQVRQSADVLQKAHPFLQSLLADEADTGRLYYQMQDNLSIPVTEKADVNLWQQDYDEISGRGLLQLAEEFAEHYVKGIIPQFAEERLIQSLQDMPEGSDLPVVSKLIINSANKKWKKEQHRVTYEKYTEFEKAYIRKNKVKREIKTVCAEETEKIQALCRQQGISVNDCLIAQMMLEEHTDKVVIAADIRSRLKCYRQGAMGNYATAFSVAVKKKEENIISLAKKAAAQVLNIRRHPRKEMLVLACYIHMQPELTDAVAISTLGDFESKAGAFVGNHMFGFGAQKGYSITNLGKIQSDVIAYAAFIPPASPANKKTLGVLTVNGNMKICSAVADT